MGFLRELRGVTIISGRKAKKAKRVTRLHGIWTADRDNSQPSEWIAQLFVITVFSAIERILPVFVREAKAL
jgi:hypothetical protein